MSTTTPAASSDLLKSRTIAQLKSDYREALKRERAATKPGAAEDLHEVRRIITIELLDRMGHEDFVAFEAFATQKQTRDEPKTSIADEYIAPGTIIKRTSDSVEALVICGAYNGDTLTVSRLDTPPGGWEPWPCDFMNLSLAAKAPAGAIANHENEIISAMSESEAREHYALAVIACRSGLQATDTRDRLYSHIQTLADRRTADRVAANDGDGRR